MQGFAEFSYTVVSRARLMRLPPPCFASVRSHHMHAVTTQGKPATTTPFAMQAAALGVEPIHGGAWDDLEMRVEVRGGGGSRARRHG